MPEDATGYGALLQRYRRAADLTQEALAERAGTSARGISDLKRGVRRRPYPVTAHLLADALALAPPEREALLAAARRSPPPAPAGPAEVVPPADLPAPLTPLIGREREVAAVAQRLQCPHVHLLTLTGPAGVGKTRLALAVAAEAGGGYAAGARFVPLAEVGDPALVAARIAQALAIGETREQPLAERLRDTLRERALLLVLDNFEHLLAAASLLSELLVAAPRLTLLVTSRAALRLSGEEVYPVPPLSLPEPRHADDPAALAQSPAVTLFVERGQSVRPDFRLTSENAGAVAAICRQLDGLPLALELAAARLRLFSPVTLLARLEHRLDLLAGGAQDLPVRQRTLRGTLDWSYGLLGAAEQSLFARLAVFAGGATLDAVEAVCGATSDVLDSVEVLLASSLLWRAEGAHGEPRVGMHATIREYATERVARGPSGEGELESTRRRHAAHYLAVAEEAYPELLGPEVGTWLARLEADHDNMRAALAWALKQEQADTALRLAAALHLFWHIHGRLREGRRWLEAALALSQCVTATVRAEALLAAGNLASNDGDVGRARALLEESVALRRRAGDPRALPAALYTLGWTVLEQGEYDRAAALFAECLELAGTTGDRLRQAFALNGLGSLARRRGARPGAGALRCVPGAVPRGRLHLGAVDPGQQRGGAGGGAGRLPTRAGALRGVAGTPARDGP